MLIHTEQGAGDAIQFARYLPLAAERCGKLILVCTPKLKPLFATVPGIAELRPPGRIDAKAFDLYLPLMSLPRVFETTLESVAASVPYFEVDPTRRQRLTSAAVHPETGRFNVGICWAGSPTHHNDKHRTCPLTAFVPPLRTPGIRFYSLQKGATRDEIDRLPPELRPTDLAPCLQDYADTAAAIERLDLVISVDTSIAHLAGALAKPVWTLLPHNPDWRWLLERNDTPWYPSMRLFRQSRPGDWAGVMRRVERTLTQYP